MSRSATRARPAPPPPLVLQGPRRPPLVRPRQGRWLGGVALGVADHLGFPARYVRLAFFLATLAGGSGALLYAWLWALAPVADQRSVRSDLPAGIPPGGQDFYWPGSSYYGPQYGERAAPEPLPDGSTVPLGAPLDAPLGVVPGHASLAGASFGPTAGAASTGAPGAASTAVPVAGPGAGSATAPLVGTPLTAPVARPVAVERGTGVRGEVVAGALLLLAGVLILADRQGVNVRPGLTLPLLVVGAGAVIAYAQLDEVERARWVAQVGAGGRMAVLRVAGGTLLVVIGVLLLVVQQADIALLGRTLVAALAVLAGVGLVMAPWGVRLWRDLDTERAARVRESERADIAAHLHDSVLQTLALIQRRSQDPAEVSRLARSQERDLRGWLYGAPDADPSTLGARVAAVVAEIEDLHGVVIEVVTVGDRPVDDRTAALVAALREAVLNAARHAGTSVQVYLESGPDGVEVNVRDRGPGFEMDAVPEDRLGVRESIIGRMERHGGSARLRSAPGEGTEVRLLLPDKREERTGD